MEAGGQVLTVAETDPLRLKVPPAGSAVGLDFVEELIHLLPDGDAEG